MSVSCAECNDPFDLTGLQFTECLISFTEHLICFLVMSKLSFFWYDYETWGANPRVDRPAQFAGIRTDESLTIIEKPEMFYCQPGMDYLPHPEAVMITGITPQKAFQQGLPENSFFAKIHEIFSVPGTCVTGYNTIRFDDEVTRFGFYRNFFDPYAWSWQNGNSRWDVIDLLRMTRALRPQGINWPQKQDGAASFKLTDLTEANAIEQTGAHDALVDVKATIEMAKLVKQHQPRLFDFYLALRNKQKVAGMLSVHKPEVLLHISGMFPSELGCLAPILPLIEHPLNSNEIICVNLSKDTGPLLTLSAEEIRQKLYLPNSELGYEEARIPLKGVHLNRSPALAPVNTLTDEMSERWSINWQQVRQNAEQLQSDANLKQKLHEVYAEKPEFVSQDADLALYEGFISQRDRSLCSQLQQMSAEQLAQWSLPVFTDERLNTLLFRYRARNYPQTLSESEQQNWRRFCEQRLLGGPNGMAYAQFEELLITLAQQHPGEREQQLVRQLAEWAEHTLSYVSSR